MKLTRRAESFCGHSFPRASRATLGLLCSCLISILTPAQEIGFRADEDVFENTSLVHLSIQIPEEGMELLRRSRSARNQQTKPQAQASVTEGERVYTNVTVQLKGFTSFQPIDRLPGLTLNFDRRDRGQKFHGLTKISLNNSLQDPSRLHEKLARELFAAAGVPVPRAGHALVTLNGRDLGLYVLTEGFDKTFLSRHFQRTDGNLYEGGTLQDIDRPLRLVSGKGAAAPAEIEKLIKASREPDPDKRLNALDAVLDLDRFISMMAMETILCHSDSYSMNRNNYRLYHDPTTDKFVFMPHGMDRVLGTHRSALDLAIVPPVLGLVAKAVLSTPEGRRRHIERVDALLANVFRPDQLCRRVCEIDSRIASARMAGPGRPGKPSAETVQDLCDRIFERATEVQLQLAQGADLMAPTPQPDFDANGVALIAAWKPKRRRSEFDTSYEAVRKDARQIWHVRAPASPLAASLRSRVSLPPGRYRLTGQITMTDAFGPTNCVSMSISRNSAARFGVERQSLNARDINFSFQVFPDRAPEEIEFICDIRDASAEAWVDASALRLTREKP